MSWSVLSSDKKEHCKWKEWKVKSQPVCCVPVSMRSFNKHLPLFSSSVKGTNTASFIFYAWGLLQNWTKLIVDTCSKMQGTKTGNRLNDTLFYTYMADDNSAIWKKDWRRLILENRNQEFGNIEWRNIFLSIVHVKKCPNDFPSKAPAEMANCVT
jgi:hypothetical protein